jgi:uncharacterized protein YjdB
MLLLTACSWDLMGPSSCASSVTVSPSSATVNVGQAVQLYATVRDTAGNVLNGYTVSWGSNNPPVATVSETGMVSGVAVGQATITAASDGQSGSVQITVTAAGAGPAAGAPSR